MSRQKLMILFVLAVLIMAVPASVLARKQTYKAVLLPGNEVPAVIDSNARGSAIVATNPDGSFRFMLSGRGFSGEVVGAHIHGPASATENAGVIMTLCGNGPTPAAVAECTVIDGVLFVQGNLPGSLLAPGVSARDFFNWLSNGLTYVNVHTTAYPAGEIRGQLMPQ